MKAILAILLVFGLMLVGAGYKLPASSVHGNLNMTSHNIIGLAAPSNETDAATKAYADSVAIGGGLPTAGGIMTGQIDFGGFTAYNSTTPINDSDLSTKKYADDLITNIDDIAISSLNTSQSFPNISMSSASDITFNGGYINDVSGIGLSDASPDSTDGILYNDSGALKFNGRSISRPFYDAEIYISGSTAYCIDEDGLIVNSSLFHNRVFSYAIAHYDNIRVVSGNYYFNSTLNTSNAEFTMYLDPNAIIHKGDGLSNAIIHFYGAASYPLIIGGQIDGEDNTVDGIRLQESIMQDRLQGVEVYDCLIGVNYYNNVFSTTIQNCYIHDCVIGVSINSLHPGSNNQNKVKDCVLNENGYGVVIKSSASHNVISDCSIENSEYWAVNIESETNIVSTGPYFNEISGCWIEGAGDGILINMSASMREPKCNIVMHNYFVGDLTNAIEFYNETSGVRNMFVENTVGPGGTGTGKVVYLNGAIWSVHMWNISHGRAFTLVDNGTGTIKTTNWY